MWGMKFIMVIMKYVIWEHEIFGFGFPTHLHDHVTWCHWTYISTMAGYRIKFFKKFWKYIIYEKRKTYFKMQRSSWVLIKMSNFLN